MRLHTMEGAQETIEEFLSGNESVLLECIIDPIPAVALVIFYFHQHQFSADTGRLVKSLYLEDVQFLIQLRRRKYFSY